MVHFLTSISSIFVSFNVLVNFINVINFIMCYFEVSFMFVAVAIPKWKH